MMEETTLGEGSCEERETELRAVARMSDIVLMASLLYAWYSNLVTTLPEPQCEYL